MKDLDYKTIKACYDARKLLEKFNVHPVKIGDRTYHLLKPGYEYWGRYGQGEPPTQVTYSQQEIIIHPSVEFRQNDITRVTTLYPTGVDRINFRYPHKEYVTFQDAAGVTRYYLVPKEGLRIQRDGDGYKAMNPVPDYHIEVDRSRAREARKPAEDLYNYVGTLWDMLPEPDTNDRPQIPITKIPAPEDTDGWYEYVRAAKFARWDSISKDTALQRIRSEYTEGALAYNVTQVPDTRTDHTAHWDKIDQLREAGRLEIYEGKPTPKRVRKTRGAHAG